MPVVTREPLRFYGDLHVLWIEEDPKLFWDPSGSR